jgi:hypothetical protein
MLPWRLATQALDSTVTYLNTIEFRTGCRARQPRTAQDTDVLRALLVGNGMLQHLSEARIPSVLGGRRPKRTHGKSNCWCTCADLRWPASWLDLASSGRFRPSAFSMYTLSYLDLKRQVGAIRTDNLCGVASASSFLQHSSDRQERMRPSSTAGRLPVWRVFPSRAQAVRHVVPRACSCRRAISNRTSS